MDIIQLTPPAIQLPDTDQSFDQQYPIGTIIVKQTNGRLCQLYTHTEAGWKTQNNTSKPQNIPTSTLSLGIKKSLIQRTNHLNVTAHWYTVSEITPMSILNRLESFRPTVLIQSWADHSIVYLSDGQLWHQQAYLDPVLTTDDMMTLVRVNVHNCKNFILENQNMIA